MVAGILAADTVFYQCGGDDPDTRAFQENVVDTPGRPLLRLIGIALEPVERHLLRIFAVGLDERIDPAGTGKHPGNGVRRPGIEIPGQHLRHTGRILRRFLLHGPHLRKPRLVRNMVEVQGQHPELAPRTAIPEPYPIDMARTGRAPRRGAAHERGVRQPVNPGARHLVAPLREHHEVLGDTVVLPVGQGIRLGARVAEDEIPREHPAHVLVLADGHLLQAIDIRFAALHHPLANIFTRRPAVSALLILRQGHPDIARRHAVYAALPGGGHTAQQQRGTHDQNPFHTDPP